MAIYAGALLLLEFVLLDQSGARRKDRGKRQEKAADSGSELLADDPNEHGDRSADEKARRELLPRGAAHSRKIYGNLGQALAHRNQSPKAAAAHTIMEAQLASRPLTLCRIMSQLTQDA